MTRPNLEGLFTGNAPADAPMAWLNGKPTAPEPPQVAAPAQPSTPSTSAAPPRATASPKPSTPKPSAPTPAAEPTGMFDPVALAERYFAMLQALLDLQREFGMRVAHQVAALPPLSRFRH